VRPLLTVTRHTAALRHSAPHSIRTSGRLAGLGLVLLALYALLVDVDRRAQWDAPVALESGTFDGFTRFGPETLLATEPASGDFHIASFPISLRWRRDYEIAFEVQKLARANVDLSVDLFGEGYDRSAQERLIRIDVASSGTRQRMRIHAGSCPPQAQLRLFYRGPPGLTIGKLQFEEVPLLRSALDRMLWVAGLLTLLVALGLVVVRRTAPDHSGSISSAWSSATVLVAIYLASALAHFAAHLFARFWSGDEYVYKAIASAMWQLGVGVELGHEVFARALDFPNLLYPYLIAPTFAAGENFYPAVRLLNALVMCAAIFPVYWIGRRCMSEPLALYVATLSVWLPFVNLAAYAVTEVLFFPLYVAAAWCTIESLSRPARLRWLVAVGVLAAALFSTRPSGVVVIPAFLLCYVWVELRRGRGVELLRKPAWIIAPLAFLPSFAFLGWLTGVKDIGSLGFYGRISDQQPSLLTTLMADPSGVLDLALGHLTTLTIPFGLPIAWLAGHGLLLRRRATPRDETSDRIDTLCVVSAVFFAALFALTLLFTASMAGSDLGGLGRWHARYYFHAYPLLLLAFSALLASPKATRSVRTPAAIITLGLMIAASVVFHGLRAASESPWFGSIVDNMDVQWITVLPDLYGPMLVATIALAALWYRDSAWLRAAICAASLVWMIVANLGTAYRLQIGGGEAPDPCGKLAAAFLEMQPGRFAVIGQPEFLNGASFWNPYIPVFTQPPVTAPMYITDGLDFIVTDGEPPPDARYRLRVDAGKCQIYAADRAAAAD
jgi:hypothetical protein